MEGLQQAKLLTNTVECESFPAEFIKLENDFQLSEQMHSEIQKKIKLCCLFEATQHKLPIKKDPLRPAWNFPRDYGITDSRKKYALQKCPVMLRTHYSNNIKKSFKMFNIPTHHHRNCIFHKFK